MAVIGWCILLQLHNNADPCRLDGTPTKRSFPNATLHVAIYWLRERSNMRAADQYRFFGKLSLMRLSPVAIVLLACVAGCATDSTSRVQNPAGAAIAPSAPVPVAIDLNDPAAAKDAARTLGYQARKRNGATMYCRNEAVIGSRFRKEICIAEDRIADIVQRAINDQHMVESIQRQCVNSTCGAKR